MPRTRRTFILETTAAFGALMLPRRDAYASAATSRVALVGYGRRGRWHARNLGDRLAAICDPALQSPLGLPVPHSTWGDVLTARGIDTVLIAAPESERASLICDALEAGLHVLAETPFALNHDECTRIEHVMQSADATLIPACHSPLSAHAAAAAKLVNNGALGPVRRINSRIPSGAFPMQTGPSRSPWRHIRGQSLGPAAEALHHQLTALRPLLTSPLDLRSVAGGRFASIGETPDAMLVELRDAAGVRVTIATSPDTTQTYLSARSDSAELIADANGLQYRVGTGSQTIPVFALGSPFGAPDPQVRLEIARFVVATSERLAELL